MANSLIFYMIEGSYWVKDKTDPHLSRSVRQSRVYEAQGEEQAIKLAEKDGFRREKSFDIISGFPNFSSPLEDIGFKFDRPFGGY